MKGTDMQTSGGEPESIAVRWAAVSRRVERAAVRADRDPALVTVIAVSKTHPAPVVTEAVAAGAVDLGENRVQEAVEKKPDVRGGARWHLIGPLQRNKVKRALETFDVVHTLDRPELGDRLQRLLDQHWPGRRLPVLLEVNIGNETQKAGVTPNAAANLVRLIVRDHPALDLRGLMAIPPFGPDGEASRPYFKALADLRSDLREASGLPLPDLSMGMSHDFEVAIEEGATMVRIGTAIFGARRPYPTR